MFLLLPPLLPALGLGLLLAQGAQAEDRFDISLGGDHLGQVAYDRSGGTQNLTLLLDSTPFGVFDGTYSGRTVSLGAVARHSGRTRSTRKSRDLSMRLEDGQLREVKLVPETEHTALTDVGPGPEPVRDPVSAFGDLLEATSCPDELRIYDGRRVGQLTLREQLRDGTQVSCNMAYRVIEGPGYLEPLGLSRFSAELTYDVSGPDWELKQIVAKSGLFGIAIIQKGY